MGGIEMYQPYKLQICKMAGETEGDILGTYTYKILNHTESSITLEMWGITANLTKVPDSTIDKYLT